MSGYEDLTYEVKDRAALVTLNRPDKLNAWTTAMEKSLKRAMAEAVADDEVRVIVITGAGRCFCAGADMNLLQSIKPGKWEDRELASAAREETYDFASGLGPDVSPHYGGRFGYLMQVKKPIIAAINGPAAGLGLVVALYADMRFAGDLLMSARKVSAAEAAEMGLVNKTFPQENFMANVMDYAKMLANTVSPRSMAIMKAQIWKALFQNFNDALAVGNSEMQKSFGSADFKEGVAHFVEKRAANFTGR